MIGRDGRAIDLVLPVGVLSAQEMRLVSTVTQHRSICAHLVTRQSLQTVSQRTYTHVAFIVDLRLRTGTTFLRGDDDHTVRCTATVDGSRRGVLQHRESLDITRVNHCQRVTGARDTVVIHSQTVDDNQRVVRGRKRRTATNTDVRTTARSATV